MAYFVVINEQGPAWNPACSMRDQEKWAEHAAFMNSLVDEGFVILGGPLKDGSTHKARLIIKSVSEQAMRARLAEDPWMRLGLLTTLTIELWEVLLSKDE
ncbi:MAG: hypothetical protein E6K77_10855 [Candidatus Eisenbacteria bacterium]|uniref:YCII-related domain-containing protein n=1 Tax=Eiseniibacteriota bacterium TaxID=2212470 RepID=A0A538TC34_UNCEI|nr:MAG: hypothetical protein E6K77_10855 [Candidatus Eisenbacteria bacterium]